MTVQAPRVEPVLAGRIARLVPFTARHLDDPAYITWLRDVDVVSTLNLPRYVSGEVSEQEIRDYCIRAMVDTDTWFYAIELRDTGEFVGTAKAGPINRYTATADLGIMIGSKSCWGRGIATDVVGMIAGRLVRHEGLRRLTGGAMANNPAMCRVFEKLGFRQEGVFRQHDRLGDAYVDHIHFGCLRDELAC